MNLVFPIDRFKELATDGAIGSVADVHYSFMGAGLMPEAYEKSAAQVAELLNRDRVEGGVGEVEGFLVTEMQTS